MSQDFGIDNAGSGFDFDDEEDDDLESMFNKANEGEETGDDDNHLAYIYDDESQQTTSQPSVHEEVQENEYSAPQNAWEVVEEESASVNVSEQVSDEVPTYDETTTAPQSVDYRDFEEYKAPEETQQYYVEPEPEVVAAPVQPAPITEEKPRGRRISSDYNSAYSSHSAISAAPAAVSPDPAPVVERVVPEPVSTRRFNISTEEEDIASVHKTIRILDAYRKLNSKTIVAQLIYNENDVDPQDEAALVVKVLRADPMLGRMMTVLRESASEKDRVERVFYVLNTDHDVLKYLGSFLETVSDVSFDNTHDHIAFAKEIEKTINELDSKIVQHVADAQSVLVAAEEEKE